MGFKEIAFDVLKETGKPMHSDAITKIALKKGWLKTAGKTPRVTMNAALITDVNKKKEKSRFVKTGPSTFWLNMQLPLPINNSSINEEKEEEKVFRISENVSTRQKGDIAEARIAELITLYGDTTLSCYKPISDDEGIDLIVKEKGSLNSLYIQIKSRFGNNPALTFTATTKKSGILQKTALALVFCFYDTEVGDLWDYLWFVPAPEFLQRANKLNNDTLGFVAGRQHNENNKWDEFLIDKRELANRIIQQMSLL